ncbi:hypothetical protein BYT27DRAFT_7228445 [Phlegmacium glaucopus]|nr:hypothetical protein BYT27DRAFT_7228445 [Phlegmacium glaucopus]
MPTSNSLSFIDGFTPDERKRLEEEEVRQWKVEEECLNNVLKFVERVGYPTLYSFINALITTRDLVRFCKRQPEVANDWAISTVQQLIAVEAEHLAQQFKPEQKMLVSKILKNFSMAEFLLEAEILAPSTCQVLCQIGFSGSSSVERSKKQELILAATLCMLAKSWNEHTTEFQTSMGIYFLACETSRSMFNVLNHTGITLSYSQAISKLKQLSEEQLTWTRNIAKTQAFMLIWDNLNIAFKVSEQWHDLKDHFDNGTTATLIPLYGVECGKLPFKPRHTNRRPILKFSPEDLFPSQEEAQRVQAGQLWHIKDILFDVFPTLLKRLASSISPLLSVLQIPVHITKQYPLPAMHINESSLEGTLGVMDTIFQSTLELTEDDIKTHGLVLCAGDQLSLSLLDKISAIQHNNSDFMDNVGLYMEGQDGLLHVKFAQTRMVTNEFWGKPNSKSPWSLWKVNTLLGQKAITAGWKAKSLPPFCPVYKLMLNLALPANILDGFHIYSYKEKLEDWVDGIQTIEEIEEVVEKVLNLLCSGCQVAQLRHVPLENICLFNRDSLHLQQLKFAIKRGDVGTVLDVITHSMLSFCGMGKTPKYADALFSMVVCLKRMDPKVQNAWLTNWLANISGCKNAFKEMDLLQAHQNFWDKVSFHHLIFSWLSMVSVCIFQEFQTPFNSSSHTSPSTENNIKTLYDYLEAQGLQTYNPERENNTSATEAQDLIQVGLQYANTPSAFRNFRYNKFNIKNYGLLEGMLMEVDADVDDLDDLDDDCGLDGTKGVDFEDLLLDKDEFPLGSDIGDYIATVHEVIDELAHYE